MDAKTRAEIDDERKPQGATGKPTVRPRDAASLLVLDRSGGETLVLMGRRHARHVFMPGKFVFPGGRTDPGDARVPVAQGLHDAEGQRLAASARRASVTRARAIALSAIRETYEEAGLLIGRRIPFSTSRPAWQGFVREGVHPSLEGLRYIARAITPPGRVRRFDTRFFAIWRDSVAVTLADGGPTNELEELVWLPLRQARQMDVPDITQMILGDVEQRLAGDPHLAPGAPVPFYRMIRGSFVRDVL